MLTEEQIKNLKPGASLVVKGTYIKQHNDGDIVIQYHSTSESKFTSDTKCFHPALVSLAYNPDRKFKKGDKVNVTCRDGRCPVDSTKVPLLEENVTVAEDESDSGLVQVRSDSGHKMRVAFFFLNLVSSVEDQMPYSIDQLNANVLLKNGKKFATFEDYDEAQEVRDHLNAEWLKNQNL